MACCNVVNCMHGQNEPALVALKLWQHLKLWQPMLCRMPQCLLHLQHEAHMSTWHVHLSYAAQHRDRNLGRGFMEHNTVLRAAATRLLSYLQPMRGPCRSTECDRNLEQRVRECSKCSSPHHKQHSHSLDPQPWRAAWHVVHVTMVLSVWVALVGDCVLHCQPVHAVTVSLVGWRSGRAGRMSYAHATLPGVTWCLHAVAHFARGRFKSCITLAGEVKQPSNHQPHTNAAPKATCLLLHLRDGAAALLDSNTTRKCPQRH